IDFCLERHCGDVLQGLGLQACRAVPLRQRADDVAEVFWIERERDHLELARVEVEEEPLHRGLGDGLALTGLEPADLIRDRARLLRARESGRALDGRESGSQRDAIEFEWRHLRGAW